MLTHLIPAIAIAKPSWSHSAKPAPIPTKDIRQKSAMDLKRSIGQDGLCNTCQKVKKTKDDFEIFSHNG